jgi:hypothetical protein
LHTHGARRHNTPNYAKTVNTTTGYCRVIIKYRKILFLEVVEVENGHWVKGKSKDIYHFLPFGNNDIMECGQVIDSGKIYAPHYNYHIRKCKRCLRNLIQK